MINTATGGTARSHPAGIFRQPFVHGMWRPPRVALLEKNAEPRRVATRSGRPSESVGDAAPARPVT